MGGKGVAGFGFAGLHDDHDLVCAADVFAVEFGADVLGCRRLSILLLEHRCAWFDAGIVDQGLWEDGRCDGLLIRRVTVHRRRCRWSVFVWEGPSPQQAYEEEGGQHDEGACGCDGRHLSYRIGKDARAATLVRRQLIYRDDVRSFRVVATRSLRTPAARLALSWHRRDGWCGASVHIPALQGRGNVHHTNVYLI